MNEAPLRLHWKCRIKLHDAVELHTAPKESIRVEESIALIVKMGNLAAFTLFGVAESFAVDILLETT